MQLFNDIGSEKSNERDSASYTGTDKSGSIGPSSLGQGSI